jgi:hypothetical protein
MIEVPVEWLVGVIVAVTASAFGTTISGRTIVGTTV